MSAEWTAIGASRSARRRVEEWAAVRPELARFPSPAAMVEFCEQRWAVEANAVLGALVSLAGDDELANRTVVQALLPGLAAMSRRARRRWPWMFEHACDGPWANWGFDHEAVATLHVRVRGLAADARPWPASVLLDRVWRRMRWVEHQFRREHAEVCARRWGLAPSGPVVRSESPSTIDRWAAAAEEESAAAQLAFLLGEGVRRKLVPRRGAELVYLSRIEGRTVAEIARERGQDEALLRWHRSEAERRLAAYGAVLVA